MLLTPLTGVLADRWDRHRVMIWVQFWAMIQAFTLAGLTLAGWITIWQLIALSSLLGFINAIDAPNRHAFVADLVDDRRDLPNAIAMNSAIFNSARLIGPSLAGITIAVIGEGLCFLINAISFVAVIFSLKAMKLPQHTPKGPLRIAEIKKELFLGFRYTFSHRTMRRILIHFALVSMLGTSFSVLLPVIAKDILHGDASTLGFLTGALGCGALISAIALARRHKIQGLDRMVGWFTVLFGMALSALSLSRNIPLSIFIMVLIGMGMVAQMTTSNTYLHMTVDDDKRARVMAFYLLAYFASMPLGSLVTGALAEIIGAPKTIFFCGMACLISSMAYLSATQSEARPETSPSKQ